MAGVLSQIKVWKMLVERFGEAEIARILEYEPSEIRTAVRTNRQFEVTESRLLNPLILQAMREQQELDAKRQEEAAAAESELDLLKARHEAEEMVYSSRESAFQIVIFKACEDLREATGKEFRLDFRVSPHGRVLLRGGVYQPRVASDLIRNAEGKWVTVDRPMGVVLLKSLEDRFHIQEDNIGVCLARLLDRLLEGIGLDLTTARYVGDHINSGVDVLRQECWFSGFWRDHCDLNGFKAPERTPAKITWMGKVVVNGWQEDAFCQVEGGRERLNFFQTLKSGQPKLRPLCEVTFERLRPDAGFPELDEARLKSVLF